jgi:hypothetical protein
VVTEVASHAGRTDAIIVFPATAVSAFSYYARTDHALRVRSGPTWPPVQWNTPFSRAFPNSLVLHAVSLTRYPAVWLVIREPHGPTIARDVRRSPVLASLRSRLGRRYSEVALLPPWNEQDTVFVVRYARPVGP